MEDKLVSKHILDASQYEGKGKWKGSYTRMGCIPNYFMALHAYQNVQQAMLDFC